MEAGRLTENIEIYSPNIIKNELGEQVNTYSYKLRTKANKLSNSGNRKLENHEIVYSYNLVFEVRYYIDVEETDRIKYNNKFHRILSIDKNNLLQKIIITTELINE